MSLVRQFPNRLLDRDARDEAGGDGPKGVENPRLGRPTLTLVRWLVVLLLLALIAPAAVAQAQTFPERPIRLIVAFSPGGATDVLARQIANDLREAIGQPVVVENRPGANGLIAWTHVAASDPDGYTLLMAENALAISQGLYKHINFDPNRQLDAVCLVANAPLALVTSTKVKANTLAEFIAYARTVPGQLNFSSAGIGSVAHLVFEVFAAGADIQAVHVPYKGGGQAIGDVVAGHIDAVMSAIPVAKGLIEQRQVKGLAVTSPERSPALPNLPTLREAGVKTADVELSFWWGVFGPAGMPEPVKAKLSAAVATTLKSPRVRERLAALDIDPTFAPAPVLQAKLAHEITNWTKFIDEHGIKTE
jgi:tripartite-type tricarboxylate transporter receptor subunit TctC